MKNIKLLQNPNLVIWLNQAILPLNLCVSLKNHSKSQDFSQNRLT